MSDDRHPELDDDLARLDASLRSGDSGATRDLYLAIDATLTRYVRGEEGILFPALERFTSMPSTATASMRGEHRSIRRLLDTLGEMIGRADIRRGLEVLTTLRSVLLLHIAKEEWLLHPLIRPSTA